MTEKRFKLHIEWYNKEKTDGEATLHENGQPLGVIESIEDARLIRNILNELYDENEELKKENNDLKTSKEYWREKCLSKDSYNKFHFKAPIWFTQEIKLTNKEVNKVAEAIEQDLKERRIKE